MKISNKQRILERMINNPLTSYEVSQLTGLEMEETKKRMVDLENEGKIRQNKGQTRIFDENIYIVYAIVPENLKQIALDLRFKERQEAWRKQGKKYGYTFQ